MFDLYEELRKVIAAFDKNQIDYALCGGLAMAVYDHPRATIDIDMLIQSEDFESIPEIAKELGYTIRGLDMSFASGAIEIRVECRMINSLQGCWLAAWVRRKSASRSRAGRYHRGRSAAGR